MRKEDHNIELGYEAEHMKRRAFLIGTATVALAGCIGGDDELYSEDDDLLPSEVGEDWPDQELQPDHDLNPHFDQVWVTDDYSLVVLMHAEVEETVEEAEDAFQKSMASATDPNDYPMADEAYISNEDPAALVMFRHSNARAQVLVSRNGRPDRTRASTYAELVFEGWQ